MHPNQTKIDKNQGSILLASDYEPIKAIRS